MNDIEKLLKFVKDNSNKGKEVIVNDFLKRINYSTYESQYDFLKGLQELGYIKLFSGGLGIGTTSSGYENLNKNDNLRVEITTSGIEYLKDNYNNKYTRKTYIVTVIATIIAAIGLGIAVEKCS